MKWMNDKKFWLTEVQSTCGVEEKEVDDGKQGHEASHRQSAILDQASTPLTWNRRFQMIRA
jgi:hypothetical protein